MKATKTLNISPTLHKTLKILAVNTGWPLGDYVNAILELGIKHREELTQFSEADTTTESLQEPE